MRLLTIEQVAAILQTKVNFIYSLTASKRIRFVKMGHRTLRIPEDTLEEFISKQTVRKGGGGSDDGRISGLGRAKRVEREARTSPAANQGKYQRPAPTASED